MPPPIHWTPFTWVEMEQQVSDENVVLLYCHPTYAVPDDYLLEEFHDLRLLRLHADGSFVARTLKYDDWEGDDIRKVFQHVGHTKYPMAILFRPGVPPIRIDTLPIEQWLDLIRTTHRFGRGE
ncbi:hypothetical protein Enr13x_00760 [Stieleria neptunia]|uniref:Uncharacterized protein n=2 Tax=Stieleria neptunia TaxID=2527979 RepID=A0A518HHH4_9BACT|nr:hypothetical protein Enr13x_00760 [Stieleria neptunia]